MPAGILMIDCGWSEYYGNWNFKASSFHDPKGMVDKLHQMGFKVMLWLCPFISADSPEFRYLRNHNCLVKDKDGNPSIKQWWDGYSAVLDMSNPSAVEWLLNITQVLMCDFGIDGFKLDAGDAYFYSDDDVTYHHVDANTQCKLWAEFGKNFAYNEYRACFLCGGQPVGTTIMGQTPQMGYGYGSCGTYTGYASRIHTWLSLYVSRYGWGRGLSQFCSKCQFP